MTGPETRRGVAAAAAADMQLEAARGELADVGRLGVGVAGAGHRPEHSRNIGARRGLWSLAALPVRRRCPKSHAMTDAPKPPLQAVIVPVTPLQQNCTLLWCTATDARGVRRSGRRPRPADGGGGRSRA